MKSTEITKSSVKRMSDKQALRDLVSQVKEWKKEHKVPSAEIKTRPPIPKAVVKAQVSRIKGKDLLYQSSTFNPNSKDAGMTPKTLQKIDVYEEFRLENKSSQGNLSNQEFTIEHELLDRHRFHPFTMGNSGIQSRASPQNKDRSKNSPSTLSDLYASKIVGLRNEPSFSRFCEQVIHREGMSPDDAFRSTSKDFSASRSPYTLNRFSATEDMINESINKSPRSGSKKFETAASMQEEISKHLQTKIDALVRENMRLKDSNSQYKEEIALLGRRVEALVHQMNKDSHLEDESSCSLCNCGRKAEMETQAKKIKRLEQTNSSLQARLKQTVTSFRVPSSPQMDSEDSDKSPGEIATSRLRTTNSRLDTQLELDRKKALGELAAVTSRFEALEKENQMMKQSSAC